MRFILDNNLSFRLARALGELAARYDIEVIHLKDKFKPNTPDEKWINELKSEGNWIIISGDKFDKSHLEQQAIKKSGLLVYQLKPAWSDHEYWLKASRLIQWFPKLIEHAEITENGAFLVQWNAGSKLKSI